MQRFPFVLREMRKWLTDFQWVNLLLPFDLIILFASLGFMFLCAILQLSHVYSSFIYAIDSICYFTFLLGVLLTLISHNVKYLPYGLWFYAFLFIFPFNSFSVGIILRTLLYAYLGYALFKFTALYDSSSYLEN
ncbi:MAG: hypothetical protein ACM3NJ_00755 [Methanobacterium sp.]